jgi:cytochrome c biogenesis protein CcmG, thiol:disulfide interchange protein DsbE
MANPNLSKRLQLLALPLLAGMCWFLYQAMTEHIVEAGDSAPGFSLVTDSGRKITRSDFGGKVLVLNFWATWCPPCIEEIPTLDAMQKQLASRGVVVLAVSVDKNEQGYKQFLNRAKVSFQTARDAKADLSSLYGTFKYPETYIINKDGKVVAKLISNQDWTKPEIIRQIEAAM